MTTICTSLGNSFGTSMRPGSTDTGNIVTHRNGTIDLRPRSPGTRGVSIPTLTGPIEGAWRQ
jgi:hypothetical protein